MDNHFRVEICEHGSSPSPQRAMWRGQHQCVSEGFAWDEAVPKESKAGEAVIRHEMKKQHFSVLRPAYLVLYAGGFPHSVVSQITRHQDSAFLVQSMRYTGDRMARLGELIHSREQNMAPNFTQYEMLGKNTDLIDEIENLFYFRPLGNYTDRQGARYEYRNVHYMQDLCRCAEASKSYYLRVNDGFSEEHARDCLPYNFRQNFMIAGDMQAVFHWLDQRSKTDSQMEIRQFAELAMTKIMEWCPEVGGWYFENRYSKAKLAP